MTDEPLPPQEFSPTRDREYEDRHYHDEEPDIAPDDAPAPRPAVAHRKPIRRLPPRRRYTED